MAQLTCICKFTQCKYLDILVICDCFKKGRQYAENHSSKLLANKTFSYNEKHQSFIIEISNIFQLYFFEK